MPLTLKFLHIILARISYFTHAYYISRPFHSPLFNRYDSARWKVHIIKLLFLEWLSCSRYTFFFFVFLSVILLKPSLISVGSMENRNFLFTVHLCKHWNNYIITVQHSPLLVQCTYASDWQARRFRGKRILSDGCAATHAPSTEPHRRLGTAFHSAHPSIDLRR